MAAYGVRSASWPARAALAAAVLVLAAACTASSDDPGSTESTLAPTGETPPAVPLKDLSERPQIWFAPLDPTPPEERRPFHGPNFMDLFHDGAPWQEAADRVHVFRLYPGWVARTATAAELAQVVSDLRRRGIAVGYESGPLPSTADCTGEIEGYAGPQAALPIRDRIAVAGGEIHFVGLQHGFDAATYGPQRCQKAPVEVAEDIASTLDVVRETFPDASANLIETGELDLDTIAEWLRAYRQVLGEYPDSLHLDVVYFRPDWPSRTREIEDHVRSLGVDFGIFYLGDRSDPDSRRWLERAWQRVVEYEVVHGGRPDHVIFQSWHPQPEQLLPDDDPAAFTNLINRYAAPRSRLTVHTSGGGDATVVGGRLTEAGGAPVADADVEVRLVPVDGPGIMHTHTIGGVVPEDATEADVGWRINQECFCSGPADLLIDEIGYREDGGANLVENSDFSRGLETWGTWDHEPRVVTTSGGQGVRVEVDAGEVSSANSRRFPVTGGAEFELTAVARVAPGTESGYFTVIFSDDDGEVSRHRLHLRTGWIPVTTVTTGADGRFETTLDRAPGAGRAVQAWYPDDDARWPAAALTPVG